MQPANDPSQMNKLMNIPQELRALRQWAVCMPDKIPRQKNGALASANDPATWCTFDEAIASGAPLIGFMFSKDDPFAVIDLDNKPSNPATPEQVARHQSILQHIVSYTEKSTSGTGYHIIVRGSIPSGVNRDHVEMYSSGRFMICTGDVVRDHPIADYHQMINAMHGQMQGAARVDLQDVESDLSDTSVLEMCNEQFGELFQQLCDGDYIGIKDADGSNRYPGQSEADMALMGMIAAVTPENEQVRRIFRMTKLGKRDKAVKNDVYLDYTLARIRGQQVVNQADMERGRKIAADLMQKLKTPEPSTPPDIRPEPENALPPPQLSLPPGLVGELAQYFYGSAVRQVPEIALAGALTLFAGIVGRQYNISNSGLAMYLVVLAGTGMGKEAAQSGIDKIIDTLRPQIPRVDEFIGPGAFASGQALAREIGERPRFLSILGEFGLTLQQISDPNAGQHHVAFRKFLLDLYGKTGYHQVLRKSSYSDTEKNTKSAKAPNLTILGEGTPATFYERLGPANLSDGLIPRFIIMEYKGEMQFRNRNAGFAPPAVLVQRMIEVVTAVLQLEGTDKCIEVACDDEGQALLDNYGDDLVRRMREKGNEGADAEMWTRAALKAVKLAGLIAVGVNWHQPVVTREIATWAINFINMTTEEVLKRFKTGDVGAGDTKRQVCIQQVIKDYFALPESKLKTYRSDPALRAQGIIPRYYLHHRIKNIAAFYEQGDRMNQAIGSALEELVRNGDLVRINPVDAKAKFGKTSELFQVVANG